MSNNPYNPYRFYPSPSSVSAQPQSQSQNQTQIQTQAQADQTSANLTPTLSSSSSAAANTSNTNPSTSAGGGAYQSISQPNTAYRQAQSNFVGPSPDHRFPAQAQPQQAYQTPQEAYGNSSYALSASAPARYQTQYPTFNRAHKYVCSSCGNERKENERDEGHWWCFLCGRYTDTRVIR
ncbi:uncharacterized protein I303_108165 [Kwoniella dejecticola CBS 10117]|uniref:Uncharacterized protein n=1 Tax=Kwoniella dejecticola CBS 10117 TaxID=1296121 RepID=A0A1A5ZY53_9TREE|nr:uncharacterized protein I303_07509 [Kwoniella dejecticola CBS 10117]OBR82742.1 hypothetical protein I303_07509 [Kwoniella dejecticola CBS 10117]